MKREAAWKIGTASRNDLSVSKKLKCTTSPGQYSPSFNTIKENSQKWKFGSEKRPDMSPKFLAKNPSP
jgi:hypothetical protein